MVHSHLRRAQGGAEDVLGVLHARSVVVQRAVGAGLVTFFLRRLLGLLMGPHEDLTEQGRCQSLVQCLDCIEYLGHSPLGMAALLSPTPGIESKTPAPSPLECIAHAALKDKFVGECFQKFLISRIMQHVVKCRTDQELHDQLVQAQDGGSAAAYILIYPHDPKSTRDMVQHYNAGVLERQKEEGSRCSGGGGGGSGGSGGGGEQPAVFGRDTLCPAISAGSLKDALLKRLRNNER